MKQFNETKGGSWNPIAGQWCFQGDVQMFAEPLPKGFGIFPKVESGVVALGEATGHAHKLFGDDFELREDPVTKTRWLKLVKPVALKHQEHNLVEIKTPSPDIGIRVGIVKEYDHIEKLTRKVID